MRFRRKERGTRIKDPEKNDASKRAGSGWGRKEGFLPSLPPPPLSFFGSRFISRAVKTESPFLGISLLRNQTETLATQASFFVHFFAVTARL